MIVAVAFMAGWMAAVVIFAFAAAATVARPAAGDRR